MTTSLIPILRMPRGPDKASGKGFGTRRKASKTAEEIKEETEEEADEEKCVASTSAEAEVKVCRDFCLGNFVFLEIPTIFIFYSWCAT